MSEWVGSTPWQPDYSAQFRGASSGNSDPVKHRQELTGAYHNTAGSPGDNPWHSDEERSFERFATVVLFVAGDRTCVFGAANSLLTAAAPIVGPDVP